MAVNLLEEDRLVYHDPDGDTLEIRLSSGNWLNFEMSGGGIELFITELNHSTVETLRDSLTCWLETGKLK